MLLQCKCDYCKDKQIQCNNCPFCTRLPYGGHFFEDYFRCVCCLRVTNEIKGKGALLCDYCIQPHSSHRPMWKLMEGGYIRKAPVLTHRSKVKIRYEVI